MKEEPKFYAIDAAIEVAADPKYKEALVVEEHQLRTFKEAGNILIKKNQVLRESKPYQRWVSVESTAKDKDKYRAQAIESLKMSTTALMNNRTPSENNLEKLQKNISSLERLQSRGIIANDDKSVESIKAQATKHLDENPKGEFEEEIDEILGDPIGEVEIPKDEMPEEDIPKEEVEIPEEEVEIPEEETPKEEGKK